MVTSEISAMLAHDERHWWYRGRRRVLRAVLDGLQLEPDARLLDAGCGSGRTLDELRAHGQTRGVDIDAAAVSAARGRGHDVEQGPVEQLPFASGTFDVVACLDVIEHTPEDLVTLRELRRVTRPGGHLVITVPAHPLLWSAHDELNLHFRRYTRRRLRGLVGAAGLDLVRETYFNGILLAPVAVVRAAQRIRGTASSRSDLERTPAALNRLLELPLAAEAGLIAHGGRVPAGLSLLVVLRRPVADEPSNLGTAPGAPADPASQPATAPASMPARMPGTAAGSGRRRLRTDSGTIPCS